MEHRIGMEIRVLSKYMGRYLDDIHGIDCMLSGPQGLILIYLCENDEEVYQKDIEKYFNIRRSTATGLLNSLEKNGYITKEPVENDKRMKKIKATEHAYSTVEKIDNHVIQLEKIMLDGIDEKEMKQLAGIPASKRLLLDIVIGYPAKEKRKKMRKPKEKVVSYNRY